MTFYIYRVWFLLLGVWCFATSPAVSAETDADDSNFTPNIHWVRGFEVRKDELPAQISASDIELVTDASEQRCNPAPIKHWGLTIAQRGDPIVKGLCLVLERFLARSGPSLPIGLTLSERALSTRKVSAAVAALSRDPSKRYVAVVRVGHAPANQYRHWAFEEAVFDRQQQRWIWHALRRYSGLFPSNTRKGEQESEEMLESYFAHELPKSLLARAAERDTVPVPGARWLEPEAVLNWSSYERAAVAMANTYYMGGYTDFREVQILVPGEPVPDWLPTTKANWRAIVQPGRTQALAGNTHAMLELLPGEYEFRVGEHVRKAKLEAGQLLVLNIFREFWNGTGLDLEDADWWRKVVSSRSRHGFLAEQRPAGDGYADSWFTSL